MRISKIIFSVLMCFPLVSCSASGRVHDKAYLRAVSVEGDTEKTLTLTFFSDKDDIITVTADNMDSAKKLAEIRSGRKIFTGYTELVILGDGEYCDTLEYILNEWKVSPSCMVVHAGKDSGIILHEISPEQLHGSIENAVKQEKSPECGIIDVLTGLLGNKHSAVIPEVSAEGFSGKILLK